MLSNYILSTGCSSQMFRDNYPATGCSSQMFRDNYPATGCSSQMFSRVMLQSISVVLLCNELPGYLVCVHFGIQPYILYSLFLVSAVFLMLFSVTVRPKLKDILSSACVTPTPELETALKVQ